MSHPKLDSVGKLQSHRKERSSSIVGASLSVPATLAGAFYEPTRGGKPKMSLRQKRSAWERSGTDKLAPT